MMTHEQYRIDELENVLQKVRNWCDAYPLDVFPEPDLSVCRDALEARGQTLDAVSARAMRHVVDGIRKLIDDAVV